MNSHHKALPLLNSLIAILVILLMLVALIPYFMDWNRLREFIADKSQQMTGRRFVIHGDLKVTPGLLSVITAERVTYENAPWGSTKYMFKAENLWFEIRLWPLLFGHLELPQIALNHVRVLLEQNEAGIGNWILDPEKSPEPYQLEEMTLPFLGEATFRDTKFAYINPAKEQHFSANLDYFLLNSTVMEGRARPLEIGSQGKIVGLPWQIAGTLGSLENLATNSDPYPLFLLGNLADFNIEISGYIQQPLNPKTTELEFTTTAKNLHQILSAFKIETAWIPPIRVRGRLLQDDVRCSIVDIDAALGDSLLQGELVFEPRESPYLSVALRSPRINLNDFITLFPEPPPHPPGRPLFPEIPLSLDFLNLADADIVLHIQQIIGPALRSALAKEVQLIAILRKGKLIVKPIHADIAGGKVKGGMIIDIGAKVPRLALGLAAKRLGLSQVIENLDPEKQAEGKIAEEVAELTKKIAGHVGGTMILRAQGNNLREIIKDLKGRLQLTMEHGKTSSILDKFLTFELGRGFIQWLIGDKSIPIECFLASFEAEAGRLQAKTLLLVTEESVAWGKGGMDLVDETVNFTMHTLPRTSGIAPLPSSLMIKGKLTAPSFSSAPKPFFTTLPDFIELDLDEAGVCIEYINKIKFGK